MSGQLYHHMALQPPEQPLTYAFDLLRAQLGLLGLGMALWGLLAVPVRLRAIRPVMLLVALVTLTFAVSYRSHDAQVYLLPVLLIGAVGVGLAVGWGLDVRRRREGIRGYGDVMRRGCEDAGDALFDPHPLAPSPTTWERGRRYWDAWCSNAVFARQRTRFLSVVKPPFRLPASRIILALLLLLLIILRLASPWPAMRAARSDQRAAQFSAALLAQAPHGAIIFTREDRDSFPLWYAHYGRDQRPDLTLVVAPLLTYDWYRANLRRHYPDLVLPHGLGSGWDMALIAQNPTRTPCWSLLDQAEVLWCQ
ncbi:MAG: hypothetical protein EI684_17885 [Candidatus Viridilinea halotolerans]|uniref:Uncharacterized protein n=1 Tax=Candidatus Viridilinea halotolerans TaxID=2491704 RepID=A0A426TTS9_9CHLR|nr:MAG: hypothetical protein EI684_17885 [Candidatus Viridilinea halotolerans]